jgi:hypothetical protein
MIECRQENREWNGQPRIDTSRCPRDNSSMNRQTSRVNKPAKDYPAVTHGARVAARGRRKANKMTDAQREAYFRRGMVLIYGGQFPEKAVAGH